MENTEKIQAARAQLMLDAPFFSGLLMRQNLVLAGVAEQSAPLAVSGETVSLSPEWVQDATTAQVKGALAKGALSNSLGHSWRMGERDAESWGQGCDAICTHLLRQGGFQMPMPNAGLSFGPSGQATQRDLSAESAESLYSDMQKSGKDDDPGDDDPGDDDPGNSGGNGQNSKGKVCAHSNNGGTGEKGKNTQTDTGLQVNPPAGTQTPQEAAAKNKSDMQAASMLAKGMGNLPGALDDLVKRLLVPVMDWREMLRAFMTEKCLIEKNWSRPNRRHVHRGIFLPGKSGVSLGSILVCVDTSGSTWDFWPAFRNEMDAILEEFSDGTDFTVHVLFVDTQVRRRDDYTPEDLPLDPSFAGGGGTVLGSAFRYLKTDAGQDIDPACCVFLTDCMNADYDREPDFPVLWISTIEVHRIPGQYLPPFGDVVAMGERDKASA